MERGADISRKARRWGFVALSLWLMAMPLQLWAQRVAATEQLRKAIDYFQSEKYHEAALIFGRLNRDYSLNPRHRAFYALCLYEEREYAPCAAILDSVMPQLEPYSPQERSVYAFAAAESHFALRHYFEASGYYDCHLSLCHADERGDTLYRLGLCAMFMADYGVAYERFLSALAYYFGDNSGRDLRARIRQAASRRRMPGAYARREAVGRGSRRRVAAHILQTFNRNIFKIG